MSVTEFGILVAVAVVAVIALALAWTANRDVEDLRDELDGRDDQILDLAGATHVIRLRQANDRQVLGYADILEARLADHGAGRHVPARQGGYPQH